MKLHFLGGAMEIGGSCIYLDIAGKKILMDCGIRQSGTKDPLPDFAAIQAHGGLDALLVSHAHLDHIGTLPIISKAYPNARIYMTAMSADLTRVLLYDSLKIMNYREDEIPHYTEQDVLSMLNRVTPVRYQTSMQIFDGFTVTFYPAGHIAGAACICMTTDEGTVFYSGDFSSFSQRTIEGIHIPKLRPDVSIVETTYGTRLHSNRQVEERRLVSLVSECIKNGQKILIPCFALGRAQEVLLILRAAIQNGDIPAVPVYVDGMVRDINTMYTRNPTFLKNALARRILKGNEPFYTKEIQPVTPNQKRDELLSGKDPVIIVSSSGMLTGGPSAQYAQKLVTSENACVIITGYQDEESPGRQLLNLLEASSSPEKAETESSVTQNALPEKKLTIDGTSYPVRCRIEQVGLSAHGDKAEITALLDRLSSRRVFLVHGNEDVIHELGNELASEDFRRHVYLPECGQEYEVTIHTKRKQLSFVPAFTMQKSKAFSPDDAELLWNYWGAHYPGKRFPVSQIAFIWYGKKITDDSVLQEMQDILLNSLYFSPNARQLFLFEANSEEDVAQALAPKELTIQDIEAYIQKIFAGYDYRRIGYYTDARKALLLFDYPDSLDTEDFNQKARQFEDETGWTADINPSMNHSAAGGLLHTLFSDRLGKVSYYNERKCYAISLSAGSENDETAALNFCQTTGWSLNINGQLFDKAGLVRPGNSVDGNSADGNSAAEDGAGAAAGNIGTPAADNDIKKKTEFRPALSSSEAIEQNLALSCIDHEFSSVPGKPEKKSLKQDLAGKYIELNFLSPEIGQRSRDVIQRCADQTGWRIRIADKVNQAALSQNAVSLCVKYGAALKKNPSYHPQERTIVLKPAGDIDPEILAKIQEEFTAKTGCTCSFSFP